MRGWLLRYKFTCRLCDFTGEVPVERPKNAQGLERYPEDKPVQAYWPNYCPNCGGELDHTRKTLTKERAR